MSIRRAARKQGNFTVIDNIVFTSGLSFRGMGMLTYLLSKPDHWRVSVTQLVRLVKGSAKADGRDAVYAILKELIEKGFVERVQTRGESGQLSGTEYVVHDTPVTPEPLTDKPHTAEPLTAETTQVNTEGLARTDNSARTDNPPNPPSPGGDLLGREESDPGCDPDVHIPEWLDAEAWQSFVEHRKQIKAKMTPKAKTMLLTKLDKLRGKGHDPKALLEESIINGWKGVFEPKGGGSGGRAPNHHTGINDLDHSQGLRKSRDGRTTL